MKKLPSNIARILGDEEAIQRMQLEANQARIDVRVLVCAEWKIYSIEEARRLDWRQLTSTIDRVVNMIATGISLEEVANKIRSKPSTLKKKKKKKKKKPHSSPQNCLIAPRPTTAIQESRLERDPQDFISRDDVYAWQRRLPGSYGSTQ